MTQWIASYRAHASSHGITLAAGDDRRAVRASAKRRMKALGIARGRLVLRTRHDLDPAAFADLCASLAQSFDQPGGCSGG